MQTTLYHRASAPDLFAPAKKRILLAIIIVVALLLRLYHINQPYTDIAGWRESSMAMMADNFYHRNHNILFPEVSWNGPGESYNGREFQTVTYTASLLYRVFGQWDWVGRLVNVCFGVWGVFALYQLVRRVWDEPHALISAAVLAVLPGALFFDRSFLPDPAMVSLVTTSAWFLMAYLQTDSSKYLALTMVFGCLGFLTKITGMLLLLPMLYAILTILSARRKRMLAALAKIVLPALLVIAIVAAYYLWAHYLSVHYPPYHFAGQANWVWDEGLKNWLQQGYFVSKTSDLFKDWLLGKPFIVLFFGGIVMSLFYIRRQAILKDAAFSAPYFFHFWLAGFLFFYSIGAQELIGNPWNFHIADPMIAAFCSSPVIITWQFLKRQKVIQLLIAFILVVVIAKSNFRVLRNTFTDKYYKADYNLGMRIQALRQPGDLVVVLSAHVGNPIPIFYSNARGWVFPPAGKEAWDELPATASACISTMEELRQKGAAWFGINTEQYDNLKKAYPEFINYLKNHYQLRAQEPGFVIFQLKQ